jgi:hypothetical protein
MNGMRAKPILMVQICWFNLPIKFKRGLIEYFGLHACLSISKFIIHMSEVVNPVVYINVLEIKLIKT